MGFEQIEPSVPQHQRVVAIAWRVGELAFQADELAKWVMASVEHAGVSHLSTRRTFSALFIFTQEVLAQFKDAVLACPGGITGCGCLRLSFQVGEVGLAKWALDDIEVKGQV